MTAFPEQSALVRLRLCPYGAPGVVRGVVRGRVLVEWTDLGMSGKHPPESLVIADTAARGDKSQ